MSVAAAIMDHMETTTPAPTTGHRYCATCHKTRLHLITSEREVCYFCGARR